MIESIVIFALGALAAGLGALLLAPAFARRTARLVEKRVRATAPLSMAEIQSSKDLLRADFAVQLRKLEVRLDEAKTLAARREMELGRQVQENRELAIELAARKATISELEARINDLSGSALGLEKQVAEQGVALNEGHQTITSTHDTLLQRTSERDEAATLANERKVEIVALKTQIENLQDRIEDLRAELAVKSVESEERSAERDEFADIVKMRESEITALRARLGRRRRLVSARRREIANLRTELAERDTRIAAGEVARAAMEAGKAQAEEVCGKLEADRGRLKAQLVDLEAKVEFRDREVARLREETGQLRRKVRDGGGDPQQAAELRENINSVAARIVTLAAAKGNDEVRKLIDAVSVDTRTGTSDEDNTAAPSERNITLAERIKAADLQPGE